MKSLKSRLARLEEQAPKAFVPLVFGVMQDNGTVRSMDKSQTWTAEEWAVLPGAMLVKFVTTNHNKDEA